MGRKDTLKDLFEMIEQGMDLVNENEDTLRSITGSKQTVSIGDEHMLREVKKQDDKVLIITETKREYDTISIGREDGNVVLSLDDKELVADVPEDCDLDGVEASLNNNVLEVTIPREE